MLVDLDKVRLRRIAVAVSGAMDKDPKHGRQLRQEATVNGDRIFVLPPHPQLFAREFNLAWVTRGKKKLFGAALRCCQVSEERLYVLFYSRWDIAPREFLPEIRQCEI